MNADRQLWLEQRHNYLTASDVAAVLGLDKSRTARDVLRTKCLPPVEDEKLSGLPMIAAGRHMEAGVLAWFAEDHPTMRVVACQQLTVSPTLPCLAATPDATIDFGTPLETKCVGFEQWPNWSLNGQHTIEGGELTWHPAFPFAVPEPTDVYAAYAPYNARPNPKQTGPVNAWRRGLQELRAIRIELGEHTAPLKYWVQLQIQMHVLSARTGWISAVIGGTSRLDLEYERHDEFLAWAFPRIEKFWAEVTQRRTA